MLAGVFKSTETDVVPELPVALELRLIEPLIRRTLMGKFGLTGGIFEHIGGLLAAQRGLQIDKFANVSLRIVNIAYDAVRLAGLILRSSANLIEIDIDLDAKVSPAAANQIAKPA